jgi:hypothetical protein
LRIKRTGLYPGEEGVAEDSVRRQLPEKEERKDKGEAYRSTGHEAGVLSPQPGAEKDVEHCAQEGDERDVAEPVYFFHMSAKEKGKSKKVKGGIGFLTFDFLLFTCITI